MKIYLWILEAEASHISQLRCDLAKSSALLSTVLSDPKKKKNIKFLSENRNLVNDWNVCWTENLR